MRIPLIIDTDPGIDDALALLIAFNHPETFDIKLITTTEGNTPINITTRNSLYLVEKYSKYPIPVAIGDSVDSPNVERAEDVHGENGLGDFIVPKFKYKAIKLGAVEAIHRTLCESKEKIVLMTLAPLTNIARLFQKYPEDIEKVEYIIAMIGSTSGRGNIRPYAEFNAYFNPEALDAVVKTGVKIIFNTLDIGLDLAIPNSKFFERDITCEKDELIRDLIHGCKDTLIKDHLVPYDLMTPYPLIYPDEFEQKKGHLSVNLNEPYIAQTSVEYTDHGKHIFLSVKDPKVTTENIIKELYS